MEPGAIHCCADKARVAPAIEADPALSAQQGIKVFAPVKNGKETDTCFYEDLSPHGR